MSVALLLAREMAVRPHLGAPSPLSPRDALMLAWLALEGPTPRQRLAHLLWPESDSAAAHNALRQRIFKLKKLSGSEIVVGRSTLCLAPSVAHDLGEESALLGDADHRFSGEIAGWLEQRRQRYRQAVRRALGERFDSAAAAREHASATDIAGELLALEPLSEEAHRRVMRTHYLAGDRAAALLAFDACEQVLKDEVGARPSAETLALLQTIEQADTLAGAGHAAAAVPASLLRPPRLIGRRVELTTALRAWDRGDVFCLEGEAGIGKSRLLQEIGAGRAGTVAVAARPGDAVVPYAVLTRLLRAWIAAVPDLGASLRPSLATLLPELATAGGPGADGGRPPPALEPAVAAAAALAASRGIGAVLVDDLHFADDASLEMLLHLAQQSAVPALRWGIARRPDEGSPALKALAEALLEERRFESVALAPLDCTQLAELLATLGLPPLDEAALAANLHQHSGGNPMFALETMRQAWGDGGLAAGRLPRPTSVTRLIERRVMRLTPAAIRLARCAAVAGSDFSIELAGAVLAAPAIDLADPWRELEQAHVFAAGNFAHDLIHEAVAAGLPDAIARHLHGEVARHLELRDASPAAIAAHWLAAGEPVRSLPFLHRAGALAAAQRRFAEAAATYERAARLSLERGDSAGAFAAALRMREAAFELDLGHRTDAALDLLDQTAASPQQRAAAAAERAIVAMHRGAMTDAERAVLIGLEALGTSAEAGLRAKLKQHLAAVRVWQQRPAEAFELLHSIEHDIEAGSDRDAQLEFAQAYAVVLEHLDQPANAARWHRKAADTALASGQMPRAAQTLLNLAIGHRDGGRLDLALTTLEEAQALLASLPEGAIPYSSLDLNFGIVMRDLGRYGESLEWLDRAIARGREHVPGWVPLFLCHRAQAWLALGQLARAGQDLEAADVADAPPLAQARRALLQAQWLGALGRPIADAFEQAAGLLGANARALSRQRMVLARSIALEPAAALAAAAEVLAQATTSGRIGVVVAARTRLCQAALALGDGTEAARHAQHLTGLASGDSSDELYRGEAWLAAARALAGSEPQRTTALLRTATDWLHATAKQRIPEPFRESFLHRNAVNRELLALAARRSS